MITTYVVDEVGNVKLIIDWMGSPPFKQREVQDPSVFLASHPNHSAGLEFANYYTGDSYSAPGPGERRAGRVGVGVIVLPLRMERPVRRH